MDNDYWQRQMAALQNAALNPYSNEAMMRALQNYQNVGFRGAANLLTPKMYSGPYSSTSMNHKLWKAKEWLKERGA